MRDYFIPHKRNGHAPYALRHKALFSYSVILVLLKVAVVVASVVLPSSFAFSSAITRANIIELTNKTRDSLGIAEVNESNKLDAAAQAKADDMLAANYFAHVSPTGKTLRDWIHGTGYVYQVAGENLAVHYSQAEDVTQGWLASPTHRANIVDARFRDIGVGIAYGSFEGYDSIFVVQMFGKPVEPAAVPVVTKPPEPVERPAVVVAPIEPAVAEVPQGLPFEWAVPAKSPSDLYAFAVAPKPEVKLLGAIDVPNLDNAAGTVYFLTIVALGAILLMSIVAKFERHRHTVTAHALMVILLAGFLARF
jgi:hypothetical protein